MHYTTVPASEASFESHDRFLDIQYMIAGQEIIGVSERSRLTEKIPYREEQDITFYEDPVTIWTQLVLQAGTLATFMPEEAHKPKIAVGQPEMIHKVVVKVRI
jgi:YhcH/YjgK/YiaL family protein